LCDPVAQYASVYGACWTWIRGLQSYGRRVGGEGYVGWYSEIQRAIIGNSKSANKLGNIIFTGTCNEERLSDAGKWQIVLVFL
jgi:hypothetical protein